MTTEASDIPLGLEVSKGFLAKYLMAAIGFAGTIVFARVLGPAAFGGFYLLWAVVVIAKLPVDGLAGACMKRFSESDMDRGAILGASLIIVIVVGAVTMVAVFLVRGRLTAYTGISNAHILFGLLFGSVSLFTSLQRLISGTGRVSRTVWIDLVRSILTLPLQLWFVWVGTGASGMAYGLALATALTIPLTYTVLGTRPSLPDLGIWREIWSFARFNTVAMTLDRVYTRLDILLLGLLIGPASAGHYEVALKLTLPAVLIANVAGDGLFARVSNLSSKDQRVGPDVTNTIAFTSILSIPIAFGVLVLSVPLVVTVYGPEYEPAATLLIGLAIYRLLQSQTSALMQTLNGLDRPDLNAQVSALTLGVNLILGVSLTLVLGAVGVVIATVVAEALKYFSAAGLVRTLAEGAEILPRTVIEQFVVATIMAGVVFLANQVVPVNSWVRLAGLVGLGALVYGIGLVALSRKLRLTLVGVARDAGFEV